ncbi:unnamed protein product [Brachionus calyciflorus]|uniref:Cation-transporting ATPase n=1 Tax=Brachionus calyciflorus TaxID=104777 RepID=A0A813PJZ3_9BILA|nr:unnamed protein product [Brachionus calyciflorus]
MNDNYVLLSPGQKNIQVINKGQDDEAFCFGYKTHLFFQILYYLIIIISLGLLVIVFYWKPEWKVYFTCRKSDLSQADYVVVRDGYNQIFVVQVIDIKDQSITLSIEQNLSSNTYQNSAESNIEEPTDNNLKYFIYHALRYYWSNQTRAFEKLHALDYSTPCNSLLREYKGYSALVQNSKLQFYGPNSIEVEVKSYFRLFFEEILTPFYIFQIAACTLWMIDEYYLYAICIIVISLISMILSLVETKRQAQTLHDMVKTNNRINVCRGNDTFEEIPTEKLVPGDIIEIPASHEMVMTCDAVLLNGNCILNESMLTGESVPVIKTPLPHSENENEIYNVETHKRSTLFNGTKVVQTRNYEGSRVLAVVVRTGFSTSKGELVKIIGMTYGIVILAKQGVKFEDLIIRALDIVTIVVPPALPAAMTVGTVYAQNRLKKKSIYCISPPRINVGGKLKLICFDKTGTLTEDGLDLWGVVDVDENKHFKHPIHNISNDLKDDNLLRCLATCHSLTRFNGGLTGDPLDIKMFESTKWQFIDEHLTPVNSKFEQVTPIVRHNKRRRSSTQNRDEQQPNEIAIVKQFTFSSSMLRMSVLCKALDENQMHVYSKGAPEKIAELCKKETLPHNFYDMLKIYTANGYRVIALAGKKLDESISWANSLKLTRDLIESDLDFYGFLIMQNMIKPETTPVINELKNAGLATVMVTGDNLLTALCVGRKCGIVPKNNKVIFVEAHPPEEPHEEQDQVNINSRTVPARIEWKLAEDSIDLDNMDVDLHTTSTININNNNDINNTSYQNTYPDIQTVIDFTGKSSFTFAMTGHSFGALRKYFPEVFEKVLLNGAIYARMSPDQKAQLVEHLISIGYGVSMCGDGANDCSALKAAHVGISLSEAEASVASPFTSKIQNISCVPEVIKEGRAALVTSFGVFKYMALYSMIQFISVLILYAYMTNLADPQFLYVDLFLITPVAVFMSANKAYEKISVKRPLGSLVGFVNICSIIFQIILVGIFQVGIIAYVSVQPWYVRNKGDPDHFKKNNKSMEGTAIFLISTFQYVVMAFVYSKGPPYRQPITKNFLFVFGLIILTAINIWITVSPIDSIVDLLSMKKLDSDNSLSIFRFTIVGLAVIFFVLSYALEDSVVDTEWFKNVSKKITRKKEPKNKYKKIQKLLDNDPQWPYVDKIIFNN